MKQLISLFILPLAVGSCLSAWGGANESSTAVQAWQDTIWRGDHAFLCIDHSHENDEEYASAVMPPQTWLVYTDHSGRADTCIVTNNYDNIWTEGDSLCIVTALDTVRYDLRRLPASIDPIRKWLDEFNCRSYVYDRTFVPKIKGQTNRCYINTELYLPDDAPAWTRRFMALLNLDNVRAFFETDKTPRTPLLQAYYSKSTPACGITRQVVRASTDEALRVCARLFEQEYVKEYSDPALEGGGPEYDCSLRVYPVWRSGDGAYITYCVNTASYMGGAHGGMEQYFLTFDNRTGRLLGFKDLVKPAATAKVLKLLDSRLNAYKHANANYDASMHYDASLGSANDPQVRFNFLKQAVRGKYYPRPALLKQGLVFSYQPYEQGCFAEGIIQFILPYPNSPAKGQSGKGFASRRGVW